MTTGCGYTRTGAATGTAPMSMRPYTPGWLTLTDTPTSVAKLGAARAASASDKQIRFIEKPPVSESSHADNALVVHVADLRRDQW